MFGAYGRANTLSAVTFVSHAGIEEGIAHAFGLTRPLLAVSGNRNIGKKDMKHNTALPKIEVDPETYEVRADGALLICEPAKLLPLAQRYFLF
jgi:urease subunit alpha